MEQERYGRWTVISKAGPKSRSGVKWIFRCDCGAERAVIRNDVLAGRSKSCGCLSREVTSTIAKSWTWKHGLEGQPEYRIWVDMRRRCHQPHRPDYHRYGGRGIVVCDQWRLGVGNLTGFEIFYRDMGKRPSPSHTMERENNDGPYSPDNCEWALRGQQGRNRRNNHLIEIDGESVTLAEAAERFGINARTLRSRIVDGAWDPKLAVTTPLKRLPRSQSVRISSPQ